MKQKSTEVLSLSLEEIPSPMLIHAGNKLLDWNTAAAKALGYKKTDRPLLSSLRPGFTKNKRIVGTSPIKHLTKKGEEIFFEITRKSVSLNKKKVFVESLLSKEANDKQSKNFTTQHLAEAFTLANMGMLSFVTTETVIISNELALLIKREKLSGKPIDVKKFVSTVIAPEDQELFFQKLTAGKVSKATPHRVSFQLDVITSDKTIRHMEVVMLFVKSKPVSVVFQDITELMQLEREREAAVIDSIANGRQLKRLLYSITDGVFAMDRKLCITMVNPVFESITNLPADIAVGKSLSELFPGFEKTDLYQQYKEAIRTGEAFTAELEYPEFDDRVYEINGYPSLEGIFVYFRDITVKKLTAQKLVDLNYELKDFQAAITNSSIVSRADVHGNITYVNQNFVDISGYSKQELVGQNHRIINSGFHPKSFWVDMWKTISYGRTWRAEVKNRAKDGSYYWVDTFVMPFLNEQGKVREFLSIRNDITKRKLAEEALERSNSSLSETLIFGKIGSATLTLQTMQLCVSKELFHLLDVEVTEAQNVPLDEFVKTYINPDDHQIIQQKIAEGVSGPAGTKNVVELEFEMLTATNRKIKIEAKGIFNGTQAYGLLHDVSDKKKAEEALTENWVGYKHLFEANPLPMWIFDVKTLEFVEVNNAAISKYGYSKDEFRSMTMLDLKREEDRQPFYQSVGFAAEYTRISHTRHKLKNNTVIDVEAFVHKIYYQGRDCHFCVVMDISDRLAAEYELRKSEERFRFLYNNTPALMHSIDAEGNLIRVSDFWLQKMEYSREEVLGKHTTFFLTEASRKKAMEVTLPEFFKTGSLKNVEYDYITKSGKILHTLLSATAEYDEHGKIIKSLAVVTDVTEKKLLELEVAKLAAISQRTSNAVVLTDVEGNVTWVNHGFERITGFTQAEVIGSKPGFFLQGPDTDKNTVARISKAIQEKRGIKEEILNYTKSGRTYWLDIEIMPTLNEAGEVNGFMAIQSDITELKKALLEMQRSEQTLQTFMDYAPLVAFVKDRDGRYTFFNKMYHDFMRDKKLVSGQTDYDLFDKDFADLCVDRDQYIIRTGETLQFEHHVGGKIFLEYKFPLRDAFHNVFAVGGLSIDISEKLEAQRVIAENEARQRQILNSMINGVIVVDPQGAITYANQGAIDILELEAIDILKLHYTSPEWKRVDEDGNQIPIEKLPLYIVLNQRRSVSNIEHGILGRKSNIKWLNVNASPLLDEQGNLIGAVASFLDVTQQKQAEVNLRDAATRLQIATRTAGMGVWEWDLITDETIYDDVLYELIGADKNTGFTFQKFRKFIVDEDIEQIESAISKAIENKNTTLNALMRIRHGKTKEIRHFLVNAFIIYNKDGNAIKMIGVDYDITERERGQRELKRVHDQLSAILNASTDATFFMDHQYHIQVFNKTGEQGILRVMDKHVKVGDSMIDYIPKELVSDFKRNFNRALLGEIVSIEREVDYNKKERVWNHVRYLPVYNSEGTIIGVSFNTTNISARKKAEQNLIQKNKQIEIAANLANMGEWEVDLTTMTPYWSDEVCRIHEVEPGYVPDLQTAINFYAPESRDIIKNAVDLCAQSGKPYDLELSIISAKGKRREIRTIGLAEISNGKPVRLFGLFQDITQQKQTEAEIIKTSRLFEVTSNINQMMVHAISKDEVFLAACHIAVTFGKFRMAWIGMVDHKTGAIKPVASDGFVEGYFESIQEISSLDVPAGKGPTGRAAREKMTFINNSIADPEDKTYSIWREEALKRNYQSSIGIPIIVYNKVIAVFTLYHAEPFFFSDVEINLLNKVASNIAFSIQTIDKENDRKQKQIELRESENRFRHLFEFSPLPTWVFDEATLKFLDVNVAAINHYGYLKEDFFNMTIMDIRPPEDRMRLDDLMVVLKEEREKYLTHGPEVYRGKSWKHIKKNGAVIDVEIMSIPINYGEIKAWLVNVNDVTEVLQNHNRLIRALTEKELLIKEIHHRVKNNLQLISSILYLKLASFENAEVKEFLSGMREKIRSISLIHERLLQTGMVDKIETQNYLQSLISDIQIGFYRKDLELSLDIAIDSVQLPSDTAMYCGLIINELVTNSIKYAFPGKNNGVIKIVLKEITAQDLELRVSDNGVGLPQTVNPTQATSFGMQLLNVFIQQLKGSLEISRDNGTEFKINFKAW